MGGKRRRYALSEVSRSYGIMQESSPSACCAVSWMWPRAATMGGCAGPGQPQRLVRLFSGYLVRNFDKRKLLETGIRSRVLDGHAYQVALSIEINVDVLTDLLGLIDRVVSELDQCGIGVCKILDSHFPFPV